MTTITIPVGVILLIVMAAVWLLWRLGRNGHDDDDDDHVSERWLKALVRERRDF